ncbi:DJ-1/PfpI family protein [Faecalibacter sp. LW9]|uniref:DJ-1/PfpI family protein n=1 Tax=Faecalibacter sp. LW9 TaxID=3103144 RepID=UPI002AFEEDC5|nr:DJ-1/PfpI family protein [Faecalibacter sp. LW9]
MPGGVINPDLLRVNDEAIQFVRHFFEKGKPVAAICHCPQTLINAEAVKGKKMTSVEAIALDLKNAGALWEDSEVVEDQGLVTSRVPKDFTSLQSKNCRNLFKISEQPKQSLRFFLCFHVS